jgi:hypothetical protein
MARLNIRNIHGKTGYEKYHCRCKLCKKAWAESLEKRRLQRQKLRERKKSYPSVTNTCIHDTLTRGEYERLRNGSS